MLTVALVGVGGISEVHIPAWNRMAETKLVALCDILFNLFKWEKQ